MDFSGVCEFIFKKFPIRFNRTQKDEFSVYLSKLFLKLGYDENEVSIKKMKDSAENNNVIVGDPEKADIYVVSHYDTPGKIGVLRFLEKLLGRSLAWCVVLALLIPLAFLFIYFLLKIEPDATYLKKFGLSFLWLIVLVVIFFIVPALLANKNNKSTTSGLLSLIGVAEKVAKDSELKDRVCFIVFDNAEWGMLGSSAFVKWCKRNKINAADKTVISVEKLGCGDNLTLFTTLKPSKNKGYELVSESLKNSGIDFKSAVSSNFFLGDHMQFKNGVMICSTSVSKIGTLYIPNVGTGKDNECDIDYVQQVSDTIYNILDNKPLKLANESE